MISTIAILGGGQAGAQAIDTLRREGFAGRLVLIGEEPHLPYQRPPLSKQFLAGNMTADRFPFRHQTFYDQHRVELKLGTPAVRIDPAAQRVSLADGEEVRYDRLLLCASARSRELGSPGAGVAVLERKGNLVGRDVQRLARVLRALKKIDEGTYGISDVSGERILRDRLEVVPEAINTMSDQEASERIDWRVAYE
jgi:NADPH-dependent 2,4-dienoyl-CoA reductase/sulfur reductase-like enzyme